MTTQIAYSPAEAGQIMGIGKTKVYTLINEGKLKAKKLGRRTLITRPDIETFMESLSDYA